MKLDDAGPPRLETNGPEPLRKFVRARQRGPSDASLERMSKRLATARGMATSAVNSERGGKGAEAPFAYYKLGLVALAVAGGLTFLWQRTDAAPTAATRESVVSPAVEPPKAEQLTTTPSEPPIVNLGLAPQPPAVVGLRPAPNAADEPAVVSVDHLPSAAPISARGSAAPTGAIARASTERPGPEPSSTELDFVLRAQTALTSDPQRALAITNEHARTYPSGEFIQEREVIAVEALSKLGQRDEARRRALALVQRHPRTPYAARLERAIGHRLPAGSATSASPAAPESAPSTP
ncbi:MAG: hypothetical protein BGO98_35515 [Myxococcales bacterium 68-20]|nr:MAG: hypothetical protein BGO98_35515 [Myxococcales bacterium 68-20]